MLTDEIVDQVSQAVDRELKGLVKDHVPEGYVATVVQSHLHRIMLDDTFARLKETIESLPKGTEENV